MIPSLWGFWSRGDVMRGSDHHSGSLFSYVDLETRVPKDHLLRAIREIANDALSELSGDFAALYAPLGRPSIPPEKLLRASTLVPASASSRAGDAGRANSTDLFFKNSGRPR